MSQAEPQGFLNNAIVGLVLMFAIPALLVVGGFYIVAQQGRIPGGKVSTCEQTFETLQFEIETYAYSAGLTPYAEQIFRLSVDAGQMWQEVFKDTIQVPNPVTCEDNIRLLEDGVYLLHNQKSLALVDAIGTTWQVYNICDAPRPSGRCDKDVWNIAEVQVHDSQNLTLTIQESAVDEYGQPLFKEGERWILSSYQVRTLDGGQTWALFSSE